MRAIVFLTSAAFAAAVTVGAHAAVTAPSTTNGLSGEKDPGRVTLQCLIKSDGGLEKCEVASEFPTGQGLGDAALKMASDLKLMGADDGAVMAGKSVNIPFQIKLN